MQMGEKKSQELRKRLAAKGKRMNENRRYHFHCSARNNNNIFLASRRCNRNAYWLLLAPTSYRSATVTQSQCADVNVANSEIGDGRPTNINP